MKRFCFGLCLIISSSIMSQSVLLQKIDSLSKLVKTEISDSLKVKVYGDLCWYYGNISIDSAFYYGELALSLSKISQNTLGEAQAYNDLGILHYKLAEYDESIKLYKASLRIRKTQNDTIGMASLYSKLGIAFQRTSTLDSALFYDNKALKIYTLNNYLKNATIVQNNIANIYNDLKQYQKALDTNLEMAEIQIQISDKFGLTHSYNNIGNSYLYLKDTVQSLAYYQKAIDIAQENNYERQLATSLNNYGTILQNRNMFEDALVYLNKSFEARKKINDNYGISSAALNIGSLYLKTLQLKKAEEKIRFALDLSKKSNAKKIELNAYGLMLSYYAIQKNTDSIIYYQLLYNSTQDSIFNTRITKEVAEIQEKYNTSEREKEISKQKEEILAQELKIKNKNMFALLLGFGLIILGLISYTISKKRKQLSLELNLKDDLSLVQTQNKLQEQRLRISRDLHDNIGSQLTFIISSIDNLKFLTKSSDQNLKEKLSNINNFATNTIAQLRDTIWAMNKNEIPFDDFHGRVLSLIEKAKSSRDHVEIKFKTSIESNIIFSSVKGINLFRTLQESLNNALKFADASLIIIEISESENLFKIQISDNGKGFDQSTITYGNGLENMKKRMEEIEGSFTLKSVINKGTIVSFSTNKNT